MKAGRIVAGMIVVLAAVAVVLLMTGGESYEVTAEFENAGQLVPGNEVVVGGAAAGSVSEIDLGSEGQALITFTVEAPFAPLREGTTVTIRSPSLSQVAGRQLQLSLPLDSEAGEAMPSGSMIGEESTIAAVDLDQIFNTLDERTVRNFKRVIQGFEQSYEGVAPEANRGFRYLNPLLSTARQVFEELKANDPALERLVVDGARLSGALAERGPDISALVGNLNQMMNSIGDRKEQLAEGLRLFPEFMRSSNTTFVNLRATLNDVDPLIDASIPTAQELLPFLSELRGTARDAVPTFSDFSALINRPGQANDLIELQLLQPKLARRALGSGSPDCGEGPANPDDLRVPADGDFTQGAFGEAVCSLTNGEPSLEFFRAYTPELVGWFDDFSHSGYQDAIGGVGRISATFNAFSPSSQLIPDFTEMLSPAEQLARLSTGNNRRCPGSAERPLGPLAPEDDSVPFTDDGHLTDGEHIGQCDPTQVAPGP